MYNKYGSVYEQLHFRQTNRYKIPPNDTTTHEKILIGFGTASSMKRTQFWAGVLKFEEFMYQISIDIE